MDWRDFDISTELLWWNVKSLAFDAKKFLSLQLRFRRSMETDNEHLDALQEAF